MTKPVVDRWWIAIGATVGTIAILIGFVAPAAQSLEDVHSKRTFQAERPGRFSGAAQDPNS